MIPSIQRILDRLTNNESQKNDKRVMKIYLLFFLEQHVEERLPYLSAKITEYKNTTTYPSPSVSHCKNVEEFQREHALLLRWRFVIKDQLNLGDGRLMD